MVKVHARIRSIELREAGYSYSHIASVVGVSKSTLSSWLAGVPYTPNAETVAKIGAALAASGAAQARRKLCSLNEAHEEAANDLGEISKRELFMLGLGLYMGEGTKSTRNIRFSNANPSIVKLIIRWFHEVLGVPVSHLRIRLHLYPDSNEGECIHFWSRFTGIPPLQFFKSAIDVRRDKKWEKARKLPFGTAHLSINSLGDRRFGVFLARKIVAWSDLVQEM